MMNRPSIRWVGQVARVGERSNSCRVVFGEPWWKRKVR